MRSRTAPVAALLFGSGFCALVYQVGWLREFRLIFGASTAASAAVLAIFIGGLGIGGLLLGARADRSDRPLLFYATLETAVALSCAATPFLLAGARALYLASGGSTRLGLAAATIERLILSVAVLAIPTIAMGGTLPAAARAVTRAGDVRRHDLAALYAFNTLGAVAGCLLSTFFLLEVYGTRATLWLAAAVNLLVAIVARAVDRNAVEERVPVVPAVPASPAVPAVPPVPAVPATPAPPALLLLSSGVVGFAFFLMELVWYRLLAPLLGGSVFTFGLVLAIALAGIGLGGLLYAVIGADRRPTLGGFAASCLLEAIAVAATYALGDRVALLALSLVPLGATSFAAAIGVWTVVAVIVVLPPAVVAGYQFPLLIALFGEGRYGIGRDVGRAYAANTVGAMVGSLAGGFGALPWLSAPGAWRFVALTLALLGLAAAATRRNRDRRGALIPHLALAAVTIALLAADGPTAIWRHSGIGAGRAPRDVFTSANQLRSWEQAERRAIVWEGDGVESAVALAAEQSGYAFIVNGKSDGAARGDAATQVGLGLLGALRHPEPRRVLVIGLGTGSTAGWVATVPTVDRVDVVELEPLVIDVARASSAVNADVLHNAKVHITIGDARELLLTTRSRYDVIASEPSNPFRAGIASLFTIEYYRAAAERLTADGVFAQWVQGYEIDAHTLRTIYTTMAAVFPNIDTWQTNNGDLVLLGTLRPRRYDVAELRDRIAREPYKTAFAHVWRATDLNGVLAHYLANDAVARALATSRGAEVNTDDRNIVEFGLARSVGRTSPILVAEVRQLARTMNASHPPLDSEAGISWPATDTAWANFISWGVGDEMMTGLPPDELLRQAALRRYFQANDAAGARTIWQRVADRRPRDPSEMAMAADIEAEAGTDAALPLIDMLRAYQPAEADTILATLRLRQQRVDEAVGALEKVFVRLRTDPWPIVRFKQKALDLAGDVGRADPTKARRLYDALSKPFSVAALDTSRLVTAAELTLRFDFAGTCRTPVAALEPHVPWSGPFLELRRDCYGAANDPRVAVAARDLADFIAHEPQAVAPR